MASIAKRIDLSVLPVDAVNLLTDFYDFLVEKYSTPRGKSRKKEVSDRQIEEFISHYIEVDEIIIPSRDEIYERKSLF